MYDVHTADLIFYCVIYILVKQMHLNVFKPQPVFAQSNTIDTENM